MCLCSDHLCISRNDLHNCWDVSLKWGLPWWLRVKESACKAGAMLQVWSLGREGPLQKGMATDSSIPAWTMPKDRGAWWATVHRVSKSWTRLKWLSTCTRQLHANTGELGKPHVKHRRTLVSLGFTQVTWLNGATLNQLLLSVQTLISQDFSISAVTITLTNTGTNLGSLLRPPLHKARCWS